MIKNPRKISEIVTFLQKNCSENKRDLHPIDIALSIADDDIGKAWYTAIRELGIDYNTPCSIIQSDDEWAQYSDFGKNTVLTVSRNSFMLISNSEMLNSKGNICSDANIYKDKKHMSSIMICFKHSITRSAYYKTIMGEYIYDR